MFDRPVTDIQVELGGLSPQDRLALRTAMGPSATVRVTTRDRGDAYLFVIGAVCAATPCPALRRGPLTTDQTAPVQVDLLGGGVHTFDVKSLPEDRRLDSDTVVVDLDRNPWVWQTKQGLAMHTVDAADGPYREAIERIHAAVPRAPVSAWGGSMADQLSREQAFILRTGLLAALALSAGALVLVLDGIRHESRRSANALVATGAPRRFLRASTAVMIAAPLAAAALVGATVSLLCCWGMLSMYGREQIQADALGWTVGPAVVLTLLAAAWGWVAGGHRFDRRLLVPQSPGSSS